MKLIVGENKPQYIIEDLNHLSEDNLADDDTIQIKF